MFDDLDPTIGGAGASDEDADEERTFAPASGAESPSKADQIARKLARARGLAGLESSQATRHFGADANRRIPPPAFPFSGLDADESASSGSKRRFRPSMSAPKLSKSAKIKTAPLKPIPADDDEDEEAEAEAEFQRDRAPGLGPAPEAVEDNRTPGQSAAASSDEHTEVMAPDIKMVIEKLGVPQPPSECFGCTHGRKDSASIAYEPYLKMEALFNGKLAVTDEIELSKILEKFYEKEIMHPGNKYKDPKEAPLPFWRAATIYFHFRHHMTEFGVKLHGRLRMLDKLIMHQYAYACWIEKKVGDELVAVPDPAGVKLLDMLFKIEASMHTQNARAMFSTGGIGAPSEETRALMNLSNKKMHTKNASRVSGTSIAAQSSTAGVGGTVQGVARGAAALRTTNSNK